SPGLIGAFALLGLFPWLARLPVRLWQTRRIYHGYQKPRHFDRNLVVIGGGSAGLVSAYIGATVKAKVTLVEQQRMGGDCLNTGCVPSKALLKSARIAHLEKQAHHYGFRSIANEFDFSDIMARVQRVISKVEPHDSVGRYTGLGVECLHGHARLISPWEVEVDNSTEGNEGTIRLTTRSVILATGASPLVPPIPGIDQVRALTSDTLWELTALPERLLVLGGGSLAGRARLNAPGEGEVANSSEGYEGSIRLTPRSVMLATGASPLVPPIPGLGQVRALTSDTLWELTALPERLLVLGGGPI